MENHTHDFVLPSPPAWSLLTGQIGQALVLIAAALFLISVLGWAFSTRFKALERVGAWSFTLGCVSLFATFAALATLFLNRRFEFKYVYGHADAQNSAPYLIAGIWSGQEGSFLLWAVCAASFALIVLRGTGLFRRWFTMAYATFLGGIAGILAYESPFLLHEPVNGKFIVPPDGVGLAPALQNYWVIIHPPTIFLGFGALTVMFAYAVAALATKQVTDWVPRVRPWSIVALTFLGLGLCMGGLWAYETLGWGGFWKWDPVENVSFVPWCLMVAFVHGIMVQVAKGKWVISNLLLGGLPFLSFVYGTFLTRSGLLGDTSVHSFAEMDQGALKLLVGMFFGLTLSFLGLWGWRAVQLRREFSTPNDGTQPANREGMIKAGSVLMAAFALTTGVGMSVPVIMSLGGQQPKVVEEWLYHQVLAWPLLPILFLMAAAPFVSWRGMGWRPLLGRLFSAACVAFSLTGLTMLAMMQGPWGRLIDFNETVGTPWGGRFPSLPWVLFLGYACWFVVAANAIRIVETWRKSKWSAPAFLSHLGVGVLMAGLILSRGLERRAEVIVQEGLPGAGLGYVVQVGDHTKDLTNRDNKVEFSMESGTDKFKVFPGFYYAQGNDGQPSPMVWPAINHRFFYDIYFTLHPMVFNATEVMEVKPGETVTMDKFQVTYDRMDRQGEAGMAGTTFGAVLTFKAGASTWSVTPRMGLAGGGGIERVPALVDNEFFVTLEGMDAGTNSAKVQLHFLKPLYPIELFYKPMTGLVWLGLGILTVAGFFSAWHRRRRPSVKPTDTGSDDVPASAAQEPEHALASTP